MYAVQSDYTATINISPTFNFVVSHVYSPKRGFFGGGGAGVVDYWRLRLRLHGRCQVPPYRQVDADAGDVRQVQARLEQDQDGHLLAWGQLAVAHLGKSEIP